MIKFFRKTRQNLLMENKTGKYLKYAIGEVVLVVIGILIALQVNNWNNKRVNADLEQAILKDLKAEISNNINALELIRDEHQRSLDAALEVRTLIESSNKLDTISNVYLNFLIRDMNRNYTYNAKLGILNSTINSGKLDLIKKKEIRYMLSSIEEEINDTNESTQGIENMRINFYWPTIRSKQESTDFESRMLKVKTSFRDSEFIFWTKFIIALRKEGLVEEHKLLDFLKNTQSAIELEITK